MSDFNPCTGREEAAMDAKADKNLALERLRDAANSAETLAWGVWVGCGVLVPGAGIATAKWLQLVGQIGAGASALGGCFAVMSSWQNAVLKWGRMHDNFEAAAGEYARATATVNSCHSEHGVDDTGFPSLSSVLDDLNDLLEEFGSDSDDDLGEEEDDVVIIEDEDEPEDEDDVVIIEDEDEEEDDVVILDEDEPEDE